MTENLKLAMIAINKWLYYGWNYTAVPATIKSFGRDIETNVPEFITEVKWTCPTIHMLEKWKKATESQNPDSYMVKFYAELDNNNRVLLLEWIMENYNGERSLF